MEDLAIFKLEIESGNLGPFFSSEIFKFSSLSSSESLFLEDNEGRLSALL